MVKSTDKNVIDLYKTHFIEKRKKTIEMIRAKYEELKNNSKDQNNFDEKLREENERNMQKLFEREKKLVEATMRRE